jgi:isoquinoline 1-oxidoreductase beta subunit
MGLPRKRNNSISADYNQYLRDLARNEGITDVSTGDFDTAFAGGQSQVEAFYETPFVAHATMEPMNCTAHWKEGNQLEIWASTQVPSDIINEIPGMFGLGADDVTLHTCFNGGGFGRRLALDFVIEAVNLSKAIKKPVKLIWTREDDMQMGPYRPLTLSAMKGAALVRREARRLPAQGDCTHYPVVPDAAAGQNQSGRNHGGGYQPPGVRNTQHEKQLCVRRLSGALLWWRSVTSSTLAFAHECFLDEMAHKAGKDPLNFRMEMLTKESDTRRVLQKLREVSNWDAPLPQGKGRGIAQWDFFAGLAGRGSGSNQAFRQFGEN